MVQREPHRTARHVGADIILFYTSIATREWLGTWIVSILIFTRTQLAAWPFCFLQDTNLGHGHYQYFLLIAHYTFLFARSTIGMSGGFSLVTGGVPDGTGCSADACRCRAARRSGLVAVLHEERETGRQRRDWECTRVRDAAARHGA